MPYPMIMNGDHAEFEQEWAASGRPDTERPDWPLPSFDARDWAAAFCKINPDGPGEDVMIGWFANSLMRGFDEHAARTVLEKRPVAWRVLDPMNGYIIFEKEDAADQCARKLRVEYEGLYSRVSACS